MSVLKLTIAYDGGDLVGWQRQAAGVSIQGLIEAALTRLTGASVSIAGAGRTDAGVHALGQVASATVTGAWAPDDLRHALNALLPDAVRVLAVTEAPAGFHARFSARAKRYEYRIATGPVLSPFLRRYAWHVTHPLDTAAMIEALGVVTGTHDFAAFQAAGSRVRDTVRTLHDARLETAGGPGDADLRLILRGDGFLRHMVRNIAGTLVEIGRGRWPPARMAEILASRDRRLAGPTAPPQGLFLVEVEYD